MAGVQEPQSRNPNLGFPILQSKSRSPNPALPIQESQSRRGALPTNIKYQWGAFPNPALPIQETQPISLNPGGVRNPGGVHFPYPYNIPILSF